MREGARPSGETTSSVANSGGRSVGGDGHGRRRGAAAAAARVPLRRLFAFADWADAALMTVGAAAAAANGMAKPLMTFVVGDVIHAFGSAGANSSRRHDGDDDVVARVTKVRCARVRPLSSPSLLCAPLCCESATCDAKNVHFFFLSRNG